MRLQDLEEPEMKNLEEPEMIQQDVGSTENEEHPRAISLVLDAT